MATKQRTERLAVEYRDDAGYLSRRFGTGPWVEIECEDCGEAVAGWMDPEGLWADCGCGLWTGYVSQ